MKKRKSRLSGDKVNSILDRMTGSINDIFDKRPPSYMKCRHVSVNQNKNLFNSLVYADFNYMMSLRFAVDRETLELLIPQSILGRAQTGQGWFADKDGAPLAFKDATFDQIVTVIEKFYSGFNGKSVRKNRLLLIQNVKEFVLNSFKKETIVPEVSGEPLLGVKFLKDREVNVRNFLKGMVLAGFMDVYSFRKKAVRKYSKTFHGNDFIMGGGEHFIVDSETFSNAGLPDPSETVYTQEKIHELRDYGIIPGDAGDNYHFPDYNQLFFRLENENGISDDIALMFTAFRYGFDSMLGAFVMDGVDTYDKFLSKFTAGGYDVWLAEAIQNYYIEKEGKPLVSEQEILDLIYFSAKNNSPGCQLSSSHRRLVQVEKGGTMATLLNHWNFISGSGVVQNIPLGYTRIPSKKFYKTVQKRIEALGESSVVTSDLD